ncbi:MAG TPA: hypothetical protein VMX94_11080 [Armatimonadota bacterium]|nr:hypothetical protein [Armatimonadota bacterium]
MRKMCIAPGYLESDFPDGVSDEQRMKLFFKGIGGWFLDVADECINPQPQRSLAAHPGFAVLSIVFSYFEIIAKCQDGYQGRDKSHQYFAEGVLSVFPELRESPEGEVLVELLYFGARNGLYHCCMPDSLIVISGTYPLPLQLDTINNRMRAGINPHLLVSALIHHLKQYEEQCLNTENIRARGCLLSRLNYQASESKKVEERLRKKGK